MLAGVRSIPLGRLLASPNRAKQRAAVVCRDAARAVRGLTFQVDWTHWASCGPRQVACLTGCAIPVTLCAVKAGRCPCGPTPLHDRQCDRQAGVDKGGLSIAAAMVRMCDPTSATVKCRGAILADRSAPQPWMRDRSIALSPLGRDAPDTAPDEARTQGKKTRRPAMSEVQSIRTCPIEGVAAVTERA